MAKIRLEGIEKRWPGGRAALSGIDLEIAHGELLVLLGPSGCGKSTLLRLVAGLEKPTRGRVIIDGTDVTSLPPQDRDLAMVFQSYALYPHKTVRENLAFGLRARSIARDEIERRVVATARALSIEPLLDRKPGQLSGGQRQRVALGRAIVREPKAFLLDEPLSNLDAPLRAQARAEIAKLERRLGATMIYVTHDQDEALGLGDRVAVLNEGRIVQLAPPAEIWSRPANLFVAGFVGSPRMNFFERGGETIGIRPHDVRLVAPDEGDARGRVDLVERLGDETHVHVETESGVVRAITRDPPRLTAGDAVGLVLPRERVHVFDRAGARAA